MARLEVATAYLRGATVYPVGGWVGGEVENKAVSSSNLKLKLKRILTMNSLIKRVISTLTPYGELG